MPIVEQSGIGGCRSDGIARYAVPRTAYAVFLVEHGGCHECRGRVSRRERVVAARIRSLRFGRIFDTVYKGCHDRDGESVGGNHASPRTAAFYPAYFQPEHKDRRSILQVIVVFMAEVGNIGVTQVVDRLFGPFHGYAAQYKRNRDRCHFEPLFRGEFVEPLLSFAAE